MRKSVRLIIIQDIYSQRGVRLKTVEIYCDFCCEDLVFSRHVLITFLFSNLIKEVLNNFVYISHFTYVKFPLYLCIFWVNEHDLHESGIEIFTSKLYFFTRKLK
jgi:hypothetical protein